MFHQDENKINRIKSEQEEFKTEMKQQFEKQQQLVKQYNIQQVLDRKLIEEKMDTIRIGVSKCDYEIKH